MIKDMTLVESLRMEANAALLAGGGTSEWAQAMLIVGKKFQAAADEIERLQGQLAQVHGDFAEERASLRAKLGKCAYALWRVSEGSEDSLGIAPSTVVSHYDIKWNDLIAWVGLYRRSQAESS